MEAISYGLNECHDLICCTPGVSESCLVVVESVLFKVVTEFLKVNGLDNYSFNKFAQSTGEGN